MKPSPLETALAAQKPIDDAPRVPLEVERLLSESQRRPIGLDRQEYESKRRITVSDHLRWKETGLPPHKDDADLAELLTELKSIERNHEE